MRLSSIRKHLRPYSIDQRRRTTIHNAFASAIAPLDVPSNEELVQALHDLGQGDPDDLRCAYCTQPAQGWDHLYGLVQETKFSGYGHTLGNLVPCCGGCNSRKGKKPWDEWMKSQGFPAARIARVRRYAKKHHAWTGGEDVLAARLPLEMVKLIAIKTKVLRLFKQADALAARIREKSKDDPRWLTDEKSPV